MHFDLPVGRETRVVTSSAVLSVIYASHVEIGRDTVLENAHGLLILYFGARCVDASRESSRGILVTGIKHEFHGWSVHKLKGKSGYA